MDEIERRNKQLNKFTEDIKPLSEERLLNLRQGKNTEIYMAKEQIDIIDKEFSRRKPFYSMADKMIDESIKRSDTTICGFYDCDEPAAYYTLVGVKNERYGLFACRVHTSALYEPTHRCLANRAVENMVKKER